MSDYKPGDEIAVRMAVVLPLDRFGDLRVDTTSSNRQLLIKEEDIIGPAPRPEPDWGQVPFGARVEVGHVIGLSQGTFLRYDQFEEWPLYILEDGAKEADWYKPQDVILLEDSNNREL
jgi:hypothetical protein